MINKEQLKQRLTSKIYFSPFVRTLALESGVDGLTKVVVELDVREISHIMEVDRKPTRISMKNGDLFLLPDNTNLHKIKTLRNEISQQQHVEEYLILRN